MRIYSLWRRMMATGSWHNVLLFPGCRWKSFFLFLLLQLFHEYLVLFVHIEIFDEFHNILVNEILVINKYLPVEVDFNDELEITVMVETLFESDKLGNQSFSIRVCINKSRKCFINLVALNRYIFIRFHFFLRLLFFVNVHATLTLETLVLLEDRYLRATLIPHIAVLPLPLLTGFPEASPRYRAVIIPRWEVFIFNRAFLGPRVISFLFYFDWVVLGSWLKIFFLKFNTCGF